MLRKVTGGLLTLMLVLTIIGPTGALAQQDDEANIGSAPVAAETTIQQIEPPAEAEEPPASEPIIEEPAIEPPAAEIPAAEPPPQMDTTDPVAEAPSAPVPDTEAGAPSDAIGEAVIGDDETAGSEMVAEDDEHVDAVAEEDADDPENDDEWNPSTISNLSVTCDGLVSFTITEAHSESVAIFLSDPNAPVGFSELASGSFDLSETGSVSIPFVIESRDAVRVELIHGEDNYWSATIYNCETSEEETTGDIINMTVDCFGQISFEVSDQIEGGFSIVLSGANDGAFEYIDGISLTPWFLDAGSYGHTFTIPESTYARLRAEVTSSRSFLPIGVAEANGCLGDETPDPDPVVPEVQNLTVTCDGLVQFDLVTTEPVVLDIEIFIPAAAPGYRDATQLSAESGPQEVQFDLPVHPYEWGTGVSLGAELLAYATVQGCPMQPLNTLPGNDVTVPVAGGTVTFENVLEPGQTFVTQLGPESAPPLPAEFDGQLVVIVDIATTAVIDGSAEVCLPIVGETAAHAENVRLLHFENGAWVDITTYASAENGVVCGVTFNFSPFAIVRLADNSPGNPVHPGNPEVPGNSGGSDTSGEPASDHPRLSGGDASAHVNLTTLPITGSGAHPANSGTQTIQLMLSALALLAAGGLRFSTKRMRGTRSR